MSGRQYHYGLGGLTQDKVHALELYRTAMKHGLSEATEAFEELQQELLMEAKEADSLQKKNPQETESCAKMMEPASTHTKTGRSLLEQEFKKFEVISQFFLFYFS